MWDFIKKVFRDICSAALDFFLFTTGFFMSLGCIGGFFMGNFLAATLVRATSFSLEAFLGSVIHGNLTPLRSSIYQL